MMNTVDLPIWVALLTSALVLLGAGLTLIGAIGLARLQTFYESVHAPTLGSSGGVMAIALGSIVFFSAVQSRPVLHEVLIVIFVTVTTPVTFTLLARAALYRSRSEGGTAVPPQVGTDPAAKPTNQV